MNTRLRSGLGPLDLMGAHQGLSWVEICPMISLERGFQLLVTVLYGPRPSLFKCQMGHAFTMDSVDGFVACPYSSLSSSVMVTLSPSMQ